MRATVRDSQTLKLVNPEDIEQYLVSHDWSELSRSGRLGAIFNREFEGSEYELLVPLTKEIGDFPQRISEILRTLEIIERRSQTDIITDLTTTRADIVRIRRGEAVDGTLPLEDGAQLFHSTHNMLLAAACTVVAPKLYYQGKRPGQATDYVQKARLGQSERGSYVVTVISPLPPRSNQIALFNTRDPFERQVTRLLAEGLDATVEASEYGLRHASTDHFRESTTKGISGNLLDAVLGIMGASHRAVDVNFAWSPEIPLIDPITRAITFDPDFAPIIAEAAKFLKSQEPQEPTDIVGVVVGLRREEGEMTGRASLLAVVPPTGKRRRVNMELDLETYSLAIRAHDERRAVVCTGELLRFGKITSLTNITRFSVAPELEEEEGPEGPLFDQ